MFLFDLKIIIRNILRNKFFSAINILGLSLGLTGTILIMLWVWDELSYDRFHDNADNIYMLINRNIDDQGNSIDYIESPAPMADYLINNIPEFKKAARIEYFYSGGLIQKENDFFKEKGASADVSLFDIFTIPFIRGDKNNVFTNSESIVISENMANRYYGDKNPIGKILKVKAYGNVYKTATITGVYKDFSSNSTIQLDFIVPFTLEEKSYLGNWNISIYVTFVLLDNSSDFNQVNNKVASIYKNVIDDSHYTSYLFPLTKLHLYSTLPFFNNGNNGNIKLINLLVFVAILILFIACINYINLSTARSVKKNKEISIKRILGANRKNMFYSFLGESFLFVLISFQIAIIIVELIRPLFNNVTGKNITINYFEPQLLLAAIIIISITSLISACYPYFYITSHKLIEVLKDKVKHGKVGIYTRELLVIFQFIISIILIIVSSVILKQVNYIYSKNLGFDKENIVIINSSHLEENVSTFKNEILKRANITSVTNGRSPMIGGWPDTWSWDGENTNKRLQVSRINSDSDYLNTLKIDLLKGHFFSEQGFDSTSIVINQKFAQFIGDENILGKRIYFREQAYKVIGITDNFHSSHFSEGFKLVAFFNEPTFELLIKVKDNNLVETIDFIESKYKEIVTDRPFEYLTLEQRFEQRYSTEVRTGKLFSYFSFLAIFISCLGLFGISVFAAEQRTKEISIRKTLGASSNIIITMLNREFVKWIIVAYIIACPIAYYFIKKWLQNFVFRTELSWWIFVLAGIIILVIAILTVSWQSYKVARKNPVESLRYE